MTAPGSFDPDEFVNSLLGSPGATPTAPRPALTKQTYEALEVGGGSYRPYDRLIALSQGERSGGKVDQMLKEAARLRDAGFTDVYKEFDLLKSYEQSQKWGTAFVVGVGKALQPLAAPQQVGFGVIGGLTDLAQGENPGVKLKRGFGAALGFLTYGAVNGADRANAISGKDLVKDWGMTGIAANVTGGLLDFFGDPLLVGGALNVAGKAARAGRLGSALTPSPAVAAMADTEALLGGASRANKPLASAFQTITSMTEVVNNVSTGAIKNPAAFRRAAGEIVRNPFRTTFSLPGVVDDTATVGGNPWSVLRENIDLVSGIQSLASTANAVARIGISPAPIKQAWQAIPLSARMSLGEAVGTTVERMRFRPLGFSAAGADTMSIGEQLFSRWGTIAGIPETNIQKLIETGRSSGTGISRKLQQSFRLRQIEAANIGMRAIDLQGRYAKITSRLDDADKRYFDYLSTKVLDAKDPAALMSSYHDFERATERFGIAQESGDFLRRVADYDVYGATVRNRIGIEDNYGLTQYQEGLDLLTMIVSGDRAGATKKVNDWLEYSVNPQFSNVMVQGYRQTVNASGKATGTTPIYNPVVGRNSPATFTGQANTRKLWKPGNNLASVQGPGAPLAAAQVMPVWNTAPAQLTGKGGITGIMVPPTATPIGGFRTSKGSVYEYDPVTGTSRRFKTPHAGHAATDVGWKDPMGVKFIEDSALAQKISMDATLSGAKFAMAGDQLLILTPSPSGGLAVQSRAKLSDKPQLGYSPLEFSDLRDRQFTLDTKSGGTAAFDAGSPKAIHIGNPIDEIGPEPVSYWNKNVLDFPADMQRVYDDPGRFQSGIPVSSTKVGDVAVKPDDPTAQIPVVGEAELGMAVAENFPETFKGYRSLIDDPKDIRRLQAALYTDGELLSKQGDEIPYDIPYLRDNEYVPPSIVVGRDGKLYVQADDVIGRVVERKGQLYLHGLNPNAKSKALALEGDNPAFREEARSAPEGYEDVMNAGSGENMLAFGAYRNKPNEIMEGMQVGAFDESLDAANQTKSFLGTRTNTALPKETVEESFALGFERQSNDIFESKHVADIKRIWADEIDVRPTSTIGGNLDTFQEFPKNFDYNGQIMFHGGDAPFANLITDLSPKAYTKGADNLYSHGIYLTDQPPAAGEYARGATGATNGKLFAIRLNQIKAMDMDNLPRDTPQVIRQIRRKMMEQATDAAERDAARAFTDQLMGMYDGSRGIHSHVDWNAGVPTPVTKPYAHPDIFNQFRGQRYLQDAMKIEREKVGGPLMFGEVQASEFIERAYPVAFHDALLERGYTAVRHVGGRRAGRDQFEHNVLILLGNEAQIPLRAKQIRTFDPYEGKPVGLRPEVMDKSLTAPTVKTIGGDRTGYDPTISVQTRDKNMSGRLSFLASDASGGVTPLAGVRSAAEGQKLVLDGLTDFATINVAVSSRASRTKMLRSGLADAYTRGFRATEPMEEMFYFPPGKEIDTIEGVRKVREMVDAIPGATLIEDFRPNPQYDDLQYKFHIELDERIIQNPDALFTASEWRKAYNTKDDPYYAQRFVDETGPEKSQYGRQVSDTENPFAQLPRDPNAWNREEAAGAQLHLRRMFLASENPELVIQRIDRAAPPRVTFDTPRLEKVMLEALVRNNRTNTTAAELTRRFQQAWSDPAVAPVDHITGFFQGEGWGKGEIRDFLNSVGKEFWPRGGIDWKPPGELLAEQMHRYLASSSGGFGGTGSGARINATSRAPEKSRQDLAPHWQEALNDIQDLGEVITAQSRVNEKLISRRGMVNDMYVFLQNEGGIITPEEIGPRLRHNRQGWRTITKELESSLKGVKDAEVKGMSIKDTPFKEGMMIPAAYYNALAQMVTTAKPSTTGAVIQWLNAKWKQHKIASPGAIVRDSAGNFALASMAGIRPDQLAYHYGMYARLMRESKRLGGGTVDLVDDTASITLKNGEKVTIKEIMEAGDFMHSGFFFREVAEPLDNLAKELINPVGNDFQRTAAALQRFSESTTGTRANPAVRAGAQSVRVGADVMGFGGPITKWLGDKKGMVDAGFKGAVYLAKRGEGMKPAQAAQYADDLFFNYENVPYIVDTLRRSGISPFAAFQFLSAGRFIKTLYENPYSMQRMYRIPGSIREANEETYDKERRASPSYIRNAMWIPVVAPDGTWIRDSKGDSQWLNLGAFLPETATGDMFLQGPGGTFSSVASPTFEFFSGLISGRGYKGMSIYEGGGNFEQTLAQGELGTRAWAMGVAKEFWRFGATPWAPGSSMMERIGRSMEQAVVSSDMVKHPDARDMMSIASRISGYDLVAHESLRGQPTRNLGNALQEGPVIAAVKWATPGPDFDALPSRKGQAAPPDLFPALLRAMGITVENSNADKSRPGSQRNTLIGYKVEADNLRKALRRAISSAEEKDRPAIRAYYQKEMRKLQLKFQVQTQDE